jgi:hypothetical protein
MRLNILIATTICRRLLFRSLKEELDRQCEGLSAEVLFEEDNKQISIGAKRQKLLERATADYIVFFDSDDWPYENYVSDILKALESNPDCVGLVIHMTTNGERPQTCVHSLMYPEWKEKVDGIDYVRNVTHFNPVRRELALKVGFADLRFGEDRKYSDAVTKLCKVEEFIPSRIFHYRYSSKEPFKKKYGIRK